MSEWDKSDWYNTLGVVGDCCWCGEPIEQGEDWVDTSHGKMHTQCKRDVENETNF